MIKHFTLAAMAAGLYFFSATGWADHGAFSFQNVPFTELRRSAAAGELAAQYELGYRFENGDGVERNLFRAYVWYNLAAAQGYPAAAEARNDLGRYLPAREIARAQRRSRRLWADYRDKRRDLPDYSDRADRHDPPDYNEHADRPAQSQDDDRTPPVDASSVTLIQRALSRLGYRPGPADGRFGPRTRAAVRIYQKDHQLIADGRPSRALMDHLAARLQAEVDAGETQYSARSGW